MRTIRTLIGCCVAIAVACQANSAFAQQNSAASNDFPLYEEEEGVAQVGLFRHCHDDCAPDCDACDLGDCDSCDGCDGSGCSLFDGRGCKLFGGRYDRCERSTCPGCKSCRNGRSCRLFGLFGNGRYCNDPNCRHCRNGLFGRGGVGGRGGLCRSYPTHERLYAPGHGYVLPTKRPMWDVSYPYHHMYNATAVGAANGQYPSSYYGNVYMPTDTTQLGYTYGHVPYWMPRPGMTPPIPHPENMHLRVCLHGYRDGVCNNCRQGHYHGYTTTVSQPSSSSKVPPKPEAAEGKALKEVAVEPTLAPIPQ